MLTFCASLPALMSYDRLRSFAPWGPCFPVRPPRPPIQRRRSTLRCRPRASTRPGRTPLRGWPFGLLTCRDMRKPIRRPHCVVSPRSHPTSWGPCSRLAPLLPGSRRGLRSDFAKSKYRKVGRLALLRVASPCRFAARGPCFPVRPQRPPIQRRISKHRGVGRERRLAPVAPHFVGALLPGSRRYQ